MTNAEGATDVWKDIGHQQVNLIRNAIEFLDDGEALTALSIVLVERALNLKRKDGTRGNAFEVKALIGTLTNGMIDIASAQSLTLQRHGPGLHRAAESLRQGEAEIYDLSRPILVSIKD